MQGLRRIRETFADLHGRMALYLATVVLVVAVAAAGLVNAGFGIGSPVAVLALAAIAAIGEWRGRITLRGNVWVSISLFPSVFAAVLFGPLAGMIVFGASALGLRIPAAGRVVYFCNRALIGCASGAAAAVVVALVPGGVEETVAAATIAALTAELVDAALTSITFALRGLGRWTEAARDLLPVVAASIPFYGPVVAVLAFAYRDVSPWTLPLFFAPALAAQRWFLMYQEQRRLTDDLQRVNEQLQAANLSFAMGLIATLDARDRYTAGHSAAVAIYARDIAQRMGLDQDQQDSRTSVVWFTTSERSASQPAFSRSPALSRSTNAVKCNGTRRSVSGFLRTWTLTPRSLRLSDTITNALTDRGTRTRLLGRRFRFFPGLLPWPTRTTP